MRQFAFWALMGLTVCSAPAWAQSDYSQPTAHAILIAEDEVVVSSQMSGRIINLPFDEGQHFKKGQVLAGFSCEILQAEEAVAVATVEGAKAELKNAQSLDKLNAAGALDLVLAETSVQRARAELEVARSRKRLCQIIAPYDGVVLSQDVRQFESVDASAPMMRIGRDAPLRVSIVAPAAWLTWLDRKTGLKFQLAGQAPAVEGKIDRIGASVDAASQTVKVEGILQGKDIKGLVPGQSGLVTFDSPAGQSQ
ncbi:hypothetical protein COO20_00015 [Thalassospira marina]|uniref:Multidrug resistance protein MdtA-like barrel-sandwich hybrid domain-containing protein n=2 Tax=Thalassospira marina TaxID=2048283 RepID=A0A2N3KYP6_9PROT|nr:hypothetical protein COO20_00015 [Thalassospira marina]